MTRAFPTPYETHARHERRALERHLVAAQELAGHARELEGATDRDELDGLPVWTLGALRQWGDTERASEREHAAMLRAGHHEHRALAHAAHHANYCRVRNTLSPVPTLSLSLRAVATLNARDTRRPGSIAGPPGPLVSRSTLASCHASNAPSVSHAHTTARMTT